MKLQQPGGYAETYARSLSDPDGFWLAAAEQSYWRTPPKRARDDPLSPAPTWFPDGTTNACEAALDRHVEAGAGDRTALVHVSAYEGARHEFTYAQLLDRVARFAGALASLGVRAGDRVLIYMPMIPEAVIAMLASARLGAIHSVVFGGFGTSELAARVDDCQPTVLITASCGLEPGRVIPYLPLVHAALGAAKFTPNSVVVKQRPAHGAELSSGELDFDALEASSAPADAVAVPAGHPLYVLYTSGTTGEPKGVVRDTGGYLTALAWSMRAIYAADPGDVFWAASDIGWVVGHSYIVYGPLGAGCTTLLYEGKPVGTPDAGAFWRIVEQHGVNVLFAAPTALRAIRRDDPAGDFAQGADLSSLRTLFLAGERADPETVSWAQNVLKVPVIDHWWQTELGWPALASFPGLGDAEIKTGAAGRPVPGFKFEIVDESGQGLSPGDEGSLLIRLPLPPGCSTALWGDDARFRRHYLERWPGYYTTGDAATCDAHGFLSVMGRTDDVINVAGHRLSTGAIEEVVAADPDVAECAVIGMADPLKGQVPLALVVLKRGQQGALAVTRERICSAVREQIGAIGSLRRVVVVDRLPKTRSGKILRRTLRSLADGRESPVPATIEDPAVLEEVRKALVNG